MSALAASRQLCTWVTFAMTSVPVRLMRERFHCFTMKRPAPRRPSRIIKTSVVDISTTPFMKHFMLLLLDTLVDVPAMNHQSGMPEGTTTPATCEGWAELERASYQKSSISRVCLLFRTKPAFSYRGLPSCVAYIHMRWALVRLMKVIKVCRRAVARPCPRHSGSVYIFKI